jgi:hypothetical protein
MANRHTGKSVQVWAPEELVGRVDAAAKAAGLSRSEFIRQILDTAALALSAEVVESESREQVSA